MNINKADAAQRWYNQADEGGLYGIASVIFGYIHHAYWDVQRARAWEALKDLQAQRRQLAAAQARIVSLEAAVTKGVYLLDEVKSWRSGRWSPDWSPENQERAEINIFAAEKGFRDAVAALLAPAPDAQP